MYEYPCHKSQLLIGLLHEDYPIGMLNKCKQLGLDLVTQLVRELHLCACLGTFEELLVAVRLEEAVQ